MLEPPPPLNLQQITTIQTDWSKKMRLDHPTPTQLYALKYAHKIVAYLLPNILVLTVYVITNAL